MNLSESAEEELARSLIAQSGAMLAGDIPGGDIRAFQQLLVARELQSQPDDGPLAEALIARSSTRRIFDTGASVVSAASSLNGQRVATSHLLTVRIWDVRTGQLIGEPLPKPVGKVWALASADGQRVVCASYVTKVRLWEVATGKVIGTLTGYRGAVGCMAFSPDGRLLAIGSRDNTVGLWDVATGRLVSGPASREGPISAVAVSLDGRLLASAVSYDGGGADFVEVWDLAAAECIFRMWIKSVVSLALSHDGRLLAAGSLDKTIQVFDLERHLWFDGPLVGHSEAVSSVAFNADGSITSASADATVRLWDLPHIRHCGRVEDMVFTQGHLLTSAALETTVRIWDAGSGQSLGAALRGHAGIIHNLIFSPDGRRLASTSDSTMVLYDTETGETVFATRGGENWRRASLEFSPTGRHLICEQGDTERVVDVETGRKLACPNGKAWQVLFSPEGHVVSVGDGTVLVWDPTTGQPLCGPLLGHSGDVSRVALSGDGRRLAVIDRNYAAQLFDVHSGEKLGEPFFGVGLDKSALSPDGQYLAFISGRSLGLAVRLWHVDDRGDRIWLDTGSWPMDDIAFSWDGRWLFTSYVRETFDDPGDRERTMYETQVWDFKTGDQVWRYSGLDRGVQFSHDRRRMALTADDTVLVWKTDTRDQLNNPAVIHATGVQTVEFSSDGRRIATRGPRGTVRVWDADTGQQIGGPLRAYADATPWGDVALGPDGRLLATSRDDLTVRTWNVDTGRQIGAPVSGPVWPLGRVVLNPNGESAASATDYEDAGVVRSWDARSGEAHTDAQHWHASRVTCLAFSQDGRWLATGCADGTARILDAQTLRPICEPLAGYAATVSSVTFSPDGRRLASGCRDGTLRIWDLDNAQLLFAPVAAHEDSVYHVAFHLDGRRLLSVCKDGSVRAWDTGTGEPLTDQLLHHDPNQYIYGSISLAIDPGGRHFATSFGTETLLWDTNTHQPLGKPLVGHDLPVEAVAFSIDGHHLATADYQGTIRIWRTSIDPDELCDKLTANMSRTQWREWISPTLEYRVVCPHLPVED
ncbi:WD40 repeat domain-containing protein [Mycobacterium sp.]|uniref:WD40 repeat domain-containing protein n=1 Tax=Mycobacterium sp. TaxID=1785 RepID=UPI003BB0CF1D